MRRQYDSARDRLAKFAIISVGKIAKLEEK